MFLSFFIASNEILFNRLSLSNPIQLKQTKINTDVPQGGIFIV